MTDESPLRESKRTQLNAEMIRRTAEAYGRKTFESMVLLRLRMLEQGEPLKNGNREKIAAVFLREYNRVKTMPEQDLAEYDPASDDLWPIVSSPSDTEIVLYPLAKKRLNIRPGAAKRAHFATHAYRCVPLTVANQIGWDLYADEDQIIEWQGGMAKDDVKVHAGPGYAHFGMGTFTLPPNLIWRLPEGWDLLIMPVPNGECADDFAAMTAIVEADWMRYPWFLTVKLTRPSVVLIPAGTSIARVLPIRRGGIENWTISECEEPDEYAETRKEWASERAEKRNHMLYVRNLHRGKGKCNGV